MIEGTKDGKRGLGSVKDGMVKDGKRCLRSPKDAKGELKSARKVKDR